MLLYFAFFDLSLCFSAFRWDIRFLAIEVSSGILGSMLGERWGDGRGWGGRAGGSGVEHMAAIGAGATPPRRVGIGAFDGVSVAATGTHGLMRADGNIESIHVTEDRRRFRQRSRPPGGPCVHRLGTGGGLGARVVAGFAVERAPAADDFCLFKKPLRSAVSEQPVPGWNGWAPCREGEE